MGLKTIKIEWDLCSNPPWIWFYPYTMFLNPMPQPSCQKSRKTIITQKVLVRQSSHIVHCDWHSTNTCMCRFSSLFVHFFPVQIDIFCQGEWSKQPKFSWILWFWLGKMLSNVLSGMYLRQPNPMAFSPEFWKMILTDFGKMCKMALK